MADNGSRSRTERPLRNGYRADRASRVGKCGRSCRNKAGSRLSGSDNILQLVQSPISLKS